MDPPCDSKSHADITSGPVAAPCDDRPGAAGEVVPGGQLLGASPDISGGTGVRERTPQLEVVFDHDPLEMSADFVAYAKYLCDSGFMSSPTYKVPSMIRSVLNEHAEEYHSLRRAVEAVETGEAEARVEAAQFAVDHLTHTANRNRYTLSKSESCPEAVVALTKKLKETDELLEQRRLELQQAQEFSESYQRREAARRELNAFLDRVGVTELRRLAESTKRAAGQASGSRGSRFENSGKTYIQNVFIEKLSRELSIPMENLRYTSNLTLRIPQITDSAGELDGAIFEVCPSAEEGGRGSTIKVMRVLMIIEMKRNIDDIGPAYASRLRTCRWLAGLEEQEERLLRANKHYPTGRYSEPLRSEFHIHYDKEDRTSYLFRPESFSYFADLDAIGQADRFLHFFAKPSAITCVPSQESARIAHYLSSSLDILDYSDICNPVNASGLEAIRLKILSSRKEPAPGPGGVRLTAFDVLRLCRVHLLGS